MQGWTPDFIPKITEDAVAMKVIHKLIPVPGAEAIRMSNELATKEGIFVGITSGGTFAGALKIADEAPEGLHHPRHAARHRRALSLHPAVCQRAGRHDAGGSRDLPLHPQRAISSVSWVER